MFWPENFLQDPQRFPVERFGFGVLARILVKQSQGIEADRSVGIIWSKNLLPDPERFPAKRFGFGVLVQISVHQGQVIEACHSIGMFWPKNLLPNPERFLVERFGFGVVSDLLEKEPEGNQGILGLRMLRTSSPFCQFTHSLRNGNRLLISSLFKQFVCLLIQGFSVIVFGQRCRACQYPEAK